MALKPSPKASSTSKTASSVASSSAVKTSSIVSSPSKPPGVAPTGFSSANSDLCPKNDQKNYVDKDKDTYQILCSTNLNANDNIFDIFKNNIEACLDACSDWNRAGGKVPCLGITFWPKGLNYGYGNCLGHVHIDRPNSDVNMDSALLISNGSSSVSSTVAPATSSPSVSASKSATSTVSSSSTLSSPSAPASSSAVPSLCPGSDGMNYTDTNDDTYEIHCGHNYDSHQNLFASTVYPMEACIQACSDWTRTLGNVPCTGISYWPEGVTYGYGNCYGRDHAGALDNYGPINSAILIKTGPGPTD